MIEATCDDREAAFYLAHELVESPEKESVCVVEETIIEKGGRQPNRRTVAPQAQTTAARSECRWVAEGVRTSISSLASS